MRQTLRAGPTTHEIIPIPGGDAGIRATLQIMRDLAREYRKTPQIRDLAKRLTVRCPSKHFRCELEQMHKWVRDVIKYRRDVHDVETVQTPDKTLADGSGDCDDKCVLLASLLQSIGHPVRFVAVGFQRAGPFSHVFIESPLGGYWRACETTEPWPLGARPKGIARRMFMKV